MVLHLSLLRQCCVVHGADQLVHKAGGDVKIIERSGELQKVWEVSRGLRASRWLWQSQKGNRPRPIIDYCDWSQCTSTIRCYGSPEGCKLPRRCSSGVRWGLITVLGQKFPSDGLFRAKLALFRTIQLKTLGGNFISITVLTQKSVFMCQFN